MPNFKTGPTLTSCPRWLEGILLIVVLAVMVLRLSFTELPQNGLPNPPLWTAPRGISLLLSSVLLLAVTLKVLIQIVWRKTLWPGHGLATGLVFFILAGAIACLAASDKRAALTELFTLSVPILAAATISRLIDSQQRIHIALWMILAMGCAAVYVGAEQAAEGNQRLIEAYRQDPIKQLTSLGIEPNSLGQFLFEHRIHSGDVRGFLTTSNSTGTFLLMGLFVLAGMIADTVVNRRSDSGFASRILIQIAILIILVGGLIVGKSRGAIGAGVIAMMLFAGLRLWGQWLWEHRRGCIIILILLIGLFWLAVIDYGIKHGRLPGPNALYVRWQYWVGAAEMIAGHPLTGVGGGNFGTLYTQYKIPAAPETVKDPHNFVLSLFCQFGPLGLAGIGIALVSVLGRGFSAALLPADLGPASNHKNKEKWITPAAMAAAIVMLTCLRPWVSEGGIPGESTLIRQSVWLVMYGVPALVFAVAFGLLWVTDSAPADQTKRTNTGLTAGLLCGIIAVLIHNLIDFAIFEPGAWTALWITAAILLALSEMNHRSRLNQDMPQIQTRRLIPVPVFAAGTILASVAALYYCAIIPIRAGIASQNGMRDYPSAIEHLTRAARIDLLDPDPYYHMGQWYAGKINPGQPESFTHQAVENFLTSSRLDPANYRYDEAISDVLAMTADPNTPEGKKQLESAYQAGEQAQRLYPGSDRIAYSLGQIAERMGNKSKTVEQYLKALIIETQYRKQFAIMYPDYPLCSRLGQARYDHAYTYLEKHLPGVPSAITNLFSGNNPVKTTDR